jgi:hypothetical protein
MGSSIVRQVNLPAYSGFGIGGIGSGRRDKGQVQNKRGWVAARKTTEAVICHTNHNATDCIFIYSKYILESFFLRANRGISVRSGELDVMISETPKC